VLIQCNTGTYSQTFFPSAIRLSNTPPVVICQLSPDSFKTHFSSFHFIWALDYITFFYRLHCTVFIWSYCLLPSVLWYCWLGGRKGIQPVKNWVVRCWCGPYGIWPSLCHSHSLSVALVKSRLVLPFWYRLTWVVPDKGSLNGSLCVLQFTVMVLLSRWHAGSRWRTWFCTDGKDQNFYPESFVSSCLSYPVWDFCDY